MSQEVLDNLLKAMQGLVNIMQEQVKGLRLLDDRLSLLEDNLLRLDTKIK